MIENLHRLIYDALMRRVSELELDPPLPMEWPNGQFNKPANGAGYISVDFLPAGSTRIAITGGSDMYPGVVQLSIYWPEGRGIADALDHAGVIALHFPKGLLMVEGAVRVRVTEPGTVNPAVQEPSWAQVPVSVPYVCYA